VLLNLRTSIPRLAETALNISQDALSNRYDDTFVTIHEHPVVAKRGFLHLPKWATVLYATAAVLLIPWIMILSYELPTRHVVTHWDLAWAGFDGLLLCSIAVTAYLGYKRSAWVMLACTSTATLLVVDAWFDILTAHSGVQMERSVFLAVIAELPFAVLSMWLAIQVGRHVLAGSKPTEQ
jgi:hypothetical protein